MATERSSKSSRSCSTARRMTSARLRQSCRAAVSGASTTGSGNRGVTCWGMAVPTWVGVSYINLLHCNTRSIRPGNEQAEGTLPIMLLRATDHVFGRVVAEIVNQKRSAGNRHARERSAGHRDRIAGDGLRGLRVSRGGLARRHPEAELKRCPACCLSHFRASSPDLPVPCGLSATCGGVRVREPPGRS